MDLTSVFHITATGTRAYPLGTANISQALALSPGGASFWSVSQTGLFEVDFVTGTVVLRGPPPLPMFGSMEFFGVLRASALATAEIPTTTRPVLLLFIAAVAAIALFRLGRA